MLNMTLTALILVLLCYIFSLKLKINQEESFGSIYHTNIIRGIAVILILISHIGDKSGLRIFTPLGGIGVSLFLICSGYGLYKSYEKNGLENYFKKRFIGLLIPYWIVFSIYSITNGVEMLTFIKGFTLIEVPSIFWYVQYIAIMYIAFYFIFSVCKENKGIVVFFILSTLLFFFNKRLMLGEQSFTFFFGLLLANINIKDKQLKAVSIGVFMIIIGGLNLVLKQTSFLRDANYLIFNLNGVMLKAITALGIFFIIYSLLRIKQLSIFIIAGKYSYEIYLVHISLVGMLYNNFTMTTIITFIAISLFGAIVVNISSNKLKKIINNYI